MNKTLDVNILKPFISKLIISNYWFSIVDLSTAEPRKNNNKFIFLEIIKYENLLLFNAQVARSNKGQFKFSMSACGTLKKGRNSDKMVNSSVKKVFFFGPF